MARLYEYADSNEDTGYFLSGATPSDDNYTMQVTDLGKRLFVRLNYKPGVLNEKRGPQIPSKLQWMMYDVGLLETGENEPSSGGFDGQINAESAEITEEMMAKLKEFVLSEETDHREITELAAILDVDPDNGPENPIWELSETEGQNIASMFETKLEMTICTKGEPDWNITAEYTHLIGGEEKHAHIWINIDHPTDECESYRYLLRYTAEESSSTPNLLTMTKASVDESRRVQIDRQRGRVLEAMSHVPRVAGVYAGDPMQDVTCDIWEKQLD